MRLRNSEKYLRGKHNASADLLQPGWLLPVGVSRCKAQTPQAEVCATGLQEDYALAFAAELRNLSIRSRTSIAVTHWATLALGSRFSRIAAKNSRSCSSMPFIDTSTLDTSILFSSPSSRSSYRATNVPLSQM